MYKSVHRKHSHHSARMCKSALSLPLSRNYSSRHKNENSIVFVLVHLHVAIIIGCSRYLNRWSYVAWEDALSRTRLMTTPPQFVLSLLSRQLYLEFRAKAKSKDVAFVRFRDFLPGAAALPRRSIVLWHG